MSRLRILLLLLVFVLPGCKSLRAQVGIGLGLGVEVSLPAILHTGLSFGAFDYVGHDYDKGYRQGRKDGDWDHSARAFFIHSISHHGALIPARETWKSGEEHTCGALFPIVWDWVFEADDTRHSWGLELAIHLIGVSVRLGFNPWYLWQ